MSCVTLLQDEVLEYEDVMVFVDRMLTSKTWLVGTRLSLADIHMFTIIHNRKYLQLDENFEKNYCNITRWYKQIQSLPLVSNAIAIIKNLSPSSKSKDTNEKKSVDEQTKTRKQEDKFMELTEVEMGEVVVRFLSKASGYLHIGHARTALLNQYYADSFGGKFILRFDDTNPAEETIEFEKAILEDLKLLQIEPDRIIHTSDYFDVLEQYCNTLITYGKAYLDNSPADVLKEQHDKRIKSPFRDTSAEKNLAQWAMLKRGEEQEFCVRAKINYESLKRCMRDPIIYCCKLESHPRTGDKYKVYPTYDFACPIVDSLENVTHTLRTTEYHDRDAQYYWILDILGLCCPFIWEYSRLNMTHTVLSKRKLTWFVNEGLVDGWDDPRFPTVRGILRRGMTAKGLKQFIISQCNSRSVVFMEWDKIWSFNKKIIDPVAVRYTALDYNETIPVNVVDAKEMWLTVQNHPKDSSQGFKQVRVGPKVLIEKADAEKLVEGRNTTFINWGNLMILKVNKQADNVVGVEAQLNLQNRNYKNTMKITWLAESLIGSDPNAEKSNPIKCYAVYFGHIMSVPVLGKDDDFKNFIAKDTRKEVQMLGEVELKRVKKEEIIELQRKGFFICDVPYDFSSYLFRKQSVILFHIPEGHASYMTPEVLGNQQEKQNSPGKTPEKGVAKNVDSKDADTSKTGTILGLEAKKEENFVDWYSQVITKSGMIKYYDDLRCYILSPWSTSIWEVIKKYINKEISALGIGDCYFPNFVTHSVLEKEKTHIADFAPKFAWVTKYGETDLTKPIGIRPTLETDMYPIFARWLKSDAELPLKVNYWNNVARWELGDCKPFPFNRELLWQEGHTTFATKEEAEEEVLTILDMYVRVYEELLAVPVIKGRKTEKEKFESSDSTITVKAFISTSGRALQGATIHHLGQNFSKMFNIQVEGDTDGDKKKFLYQNSWCLTTRAIGVMIMIHGDDKGLVLPPKVAPIQVVVIPCGVVANISVSMKEHVEQEIVRLGHDLQEYGYRVHCDLRSDRTPEWKFNHWELKGVPLRIEIGPTDIERMNECINYVTIVRRDTFKREAIKKYDLIDSVDYMMKDMEEKLLSKAKETLQSHIKRVENWREFILESNKNNLLLSPFCGEPACEENIEDDSTWADLNIGILIKGVKSLCIPFIQPDLTKPLNKLKCIHHACKKEPKFYTLFGRSY